MGGCNQFSIILVVEIAMLSKMVNSLPAQLTTTVYYTSDGRVMERQLDPHGEFQQCYVYGDRQLGEDVISSTPVEKTIFVSEAQFSILAKDCISSDEPDQLKNRNRRQIFPGTKWCGVGDIADNYDDLGEHMEEDMCCRAHDKCPVSILASETKYGLTNDKGYTLSGCGCDEKFRSCLNKVNSDVSRTIGDIYDGALQGYCVDRNYPTNCYKLGEFMLCFRKMSQPMQWQITQREKDYWYLFLRTE